MHEHVLTPVVGRDEPESLLVAEPLHGSGWHRFLPNDRVRRNAGDAEAQQRTLALSRRRGPARTNAAYVMSATHSSLGPRVVTSRSTRSGRPRAAGSGEW